MEAISHKICVELRRFMQFIHINVLFWKRAEYATTMVFNLNEAPVLNLILCRWYKYEMCAFSPIKRGIQNGGNY